MNNLLTPILLPKQKSQVGEWLTQSHTVAYTKESRGWITYTLPLCCIYKRAKMLIDLLTPILLPVLKRKEGEWLTHSHPAANKKSQEGKLHTHSHDVAYTKGPRQWMTYSPPHSYQYKRAKRINGTHSHTVAYTNEPWGWMTYSLPHCCLYKKRAKRVNDLLTPTVSPVKKNKEDELLTHSYTVAYTKELRGWMLYSLPNCCLYKKQRSWMTYSL